MGQSIGEYVNAEKNEKNSIESLKCLVILRNQASGVKIVPGWNSRFSYAQSTRCLMLEKSFRVSSIKFCNFDRKIFLSYFSA